jgi:hypothetical protein
MKASRLFRFYLVFTVNRALPANSQPDNFFIKSNSLKINLDAQ